jgi:hypothetical protein
VIFTGSELLKLKVMFTVREGLDSAAAFGGIVLRGERGQRLNLQIK